MKLTIKRFKEIYEGTIGKYKLHDDAGTILASGYTMEPAGDDCITPNMNKRIPEGIYNAVWERSPKFNRHLPVLFNESVSKNRRILIHKGNYHHDTSGCILLGKTYTNNGVFNSTTAFNEFEEIIRRNDFIVEIKNEISK